MKKIITLGRVETEPQQVRALQSIEDALNKLYNNTSEETLTALIQKIVGQSGGGGTGVAGPQGPQGDAGSAGATGPAGPAGADGSVVPTLVAAPDTYTVPADSQVLFAEPIAFEGSLVLEGDLIMVD